MKDLTVEEFVELRQFAIDNPATDVCIPLMFDCLVRRFGKTLVDQIESAKAKYEYQLKMESAESIRDDCE